MQRILQVSSSWTSSRCLHTEPNLAPLQECVRGGQGELKNKIKITKSSQAELKLYGAKLGHFSSFFTVECYFHA